MELEQPNRFLGGNVYSSPTGKAAVIWTVEDGIYAMAILFSDEQVLSYCSEGDRRTLFSEEEWASLEASLGDEDHFPITSSKDTPEAIVIRGSAAYSLYLRYQNYKSETGEDIGWHQMPPRIVGFLYSESYETLTCPGDRTLILAMKTDKKSYRVFICSTRKQVRDLLDSYAPVVADTREFYEESLARAMLDDASKTEIVTLGNGPTSIVAFYICLWIDVHRFYGREIQMDYESADDFTTIH